MAIKNKYYTASTVSRDLPTGERSFEQVVYQSGKPILDAELNHDQDIKGEVQRVISNQHLPSGFFKKQNRQDRDILDFEFINDPSDPNFVANGFWLNKVTALVAGMPIIVEYTNTDREGKNLIQLQAPTVYAGSPVTVKRTDFVFLEVWRSLVSASAKASGLVQITNPASIVVGDIVEINGENFSAVSGIAAANQFDVSSANAITIATNLATTITNDSSFAYAYSNSTDTVTIISKFAGTVGNAYTLSTTNAGSFIVSGATLAGGVDEDNKPDQDHIYRHGNNDSSVAVALDDDIQDPIINVESTKRVQIQYRIRITGETEAVNFKTQADGFSNPNILAQGGQAAPVATYHFVKADGTSTSGSSDAAAYDTIDNGLFIAGDGSSTAATALDCVDGFVYAIPICFIHRRNDAFDSGTGNGFDPQNNTNGGLLHNHGGGFNNTQVGIIAIGDSDRPDGYFADVIETTDLLDLRRHISPNGVDLAAELQYQMKCLLDGNYRTWSIDTADKQTLGAGSGDVSVKHLVCNEIGRDSAHGGNPVISGDTTRGDHIANFDHVRRRFGDQPVVERMVFTFVPIQPSSPFAGRYVEQVVPAEKNWVEGDKLHLDISTLNATTLGNWLPSTETYTGSGSHNASISDFAPPLVTITDILVCIHDDGHYVTPISKKVQIKTVEGLGTDHVIITLDKNPLQANAGGGFASDYDLVQDVASTPSAASGRRIFIEYEITYPAGFGTTDTPDLVLEPDNAVYPVGAVLENDFAFGSSQQPLDTNGLLPPVYREGFREVMIEYQAQDTVAGKFSGTLYTDSFVSDDTREITGWRRFYENRAMTVTETGSGAVKTLDLTQCHFGASTRKLKIDGTFSGQQTLVDVAYTAQDPVPNYGAAGGGYQISVYYRSNAPQTCGTREGVLNELPVNLEVTPLIMSHELWSGTIGMGSVELPFPYIAPLDQIPINDGGFGTFVGEWYFMATAEISIDDFNAETGLLNLHAFVPADGTQDYSFNTTRKDTEFRAYYAVSDVNSYRPTVFTQELSGINRHKCFVPFLAKATQDTVLFRKGEVLLMVLSRWAELDAKNNIVFADTDNRTCVGVYRTKNLLILSGD